MNKIMLKLRYPKFLLLLLTVLIAVVFFQNGNTYPPFRNSLVSLGLLGDFIGGFFYAYGFTAAPATAILLLLAKEQNVLVAGLIGGMGALISDIIIFTFIKHSFRDEIKRLKKEKYIISFQRVGRKLFGSIYDYLLPTLAGFFIASPLPTEFGVSLMASLKSISIKKFVIIAYLLHTTGILIILLIGNTI